MMHRSRTGVAKATFPVLALIVLSACGGGGSRSTATGPATTEAATPVSGGGNGANSAASNSTTVPVTLDARPPSSSTPALSAAGPACPAGRECLDDVAFDLDGDGVPDRLAFWVDAVANSVMGTGKTATGGSSTVEVTKVPAIREQDPRSKGIFRGAKNLDGRAGDEAIVFVALGDVSHFTVLTWGDGKLLNLVSSGRTLGLASGGYGGFDDQSKSLTEQLDFYCVRRPVGDYLIVSWSSSLKRTGGVATYRVDETAFAIEAKQYVAQPAEKRAQNVTSLSYPRRLNDSGCIGGDIVRPPLA